MRRSFVALCLALVLPLPALAAEVTVQPGETLSEIAARHGVSVQRLMDLNDIRKADHVEVGQVLRLPGPGRAKGGPGSGAATGRVTVREGDTLSEIADRQGMSLGQLMALNGLSKADHVEVGQVLKVTGKATATSPSAPAPAPTYRKGASVHVVRSGESLSEIAEGYGVSMERLVAINAIDDPNHVEAGSRLKLKGEAPAAPAPRPVAAAPRPVAAAPMPRSQPVATPRPTIDSPTVAAAPAVTQATAAATGLLNTPVAKNPVTPRVSTAAPSPRPTAVVTPSPRPTAAVAPAPRPATANPSPAAASPAVAANTWRPYGPLQVDWSNWQPMGGSLVAPVLNAKGETLYLAINCGARKMNATSAAGDWRTWDDPQADFERKLVNDLCSSRG
jgi:LysM repeat protein